MKDRDLLILLALVAVVYLMNRRVAAAATPTGVVTTTETYRLPDGTVLTADPLPARTTDNMAYWYSILQLGQIGGGSL